jgi:CxxC motif-containing protein (DUF1111 family)
MRAPARFGSLGIGVVSLLAGYAPAWLACSTKAVADEPAAARPREAEQPRKIELGRELFVREWLPNDRRSKGGDGLGPVYNERSCAGCHHQAGPGGGGSADKNVEIITPILRGGGGPANPGFFYYAFSFSYGPDGAEFRNGNIPQASERPRRANGLALAELVRVHPGFRDAPSVVLHRYGNDSDYRVWREWVLERHGSFEFRTSQRNPTPLFGMALIDQIPEAVIEAGARRKHPGWPKVKGRVSRLEDGRVGRFGWKAQTASLREFILAAAAIEMGLEVPGHSQAADPRVPPLKAPGPDLSADECDALLAYVASLAAPALPVQGNPRDERAGKTGRSLFKSIGCAECHVPKLGDVDNIYSDLLLHAMGPELVDTPFYGALLAGSDAEPPRPAAARQGGGATDLEWRTPPLLGLRHSAPYLHDGRAASVEEAILRHGGEAAAAAQRYRQLSGRDQALLASFLQAL